MDGTATVQSRYFFVVGKMFLQIERTKVLLTGKSKLDGRLTHKTSVIDEKLYRGSVVNGLFTYIHCSKILCMAYACNHI